MLLTLRKFVDAKLEIITEFEQKDLLKPLESIQSLFTEMPSDFKSYFGAVVLTNVLSLVIPSNLDRKAIDDSFCQIFSQNDLKQALTARHLVYL